MTNFTLLEQETVPEAVICGFSFGSAKVHVLCRTPEKVLLLVHGYSSYGGRCSPTCYSPTSIWRFNRKQDGFRGGAKLVESGRFTNKRLSDLRLLLDEAMGEEDLWKLLDIKKTLVIGQCEPFTGRTEYNQ